MSAASGERREALERRVLEGPGPEGPDDPPRELLQRLLAAEVAAWEAMTPPRLAAADLDPTTTLERLDLLLAGRSDDARVEEEARAEVRQHPARAAERRAAGLRDPAALLALATGGNPWERRASVLRLEAFLRGDGAGFAPADRRELAEALESRRDGPLGRLIDHLLAAAPGVAAGRARQRVARAQRILERLDTDIPSYWEGERDRDPLEALDDESLSAFGVWAADASDLAAGHVAETLRALTVGGREEALVRLVSALRHAADPRLVPSLVRVLQDGPPAARIHASAALSVVDDPRVLPALRKAFRHARADEEVLALAGALAAHGDRRGVGAALDRLAPEQPPFLQEAALEALAAAGDAVPAARLVPFLRAGRPSVARAAAAALGTSDDPAAEPALQEASDRPEIRPQAERSLAALRARRVAAGGPAGPAAEAETGAERRAARPRARLTARLVARLYYALGLLWYALGRRRAALGALDLAEAQNPYLLGTFLVRARITLRQGRLDAAVEALRAALRVRAASILQVPERVNFVIRVYLRHTEGCVAAGQAAPALEAMDELFGYDLRFADVDLRLEAQRRRDAAARALREGRS